jgi:hypothetical protein
MYHIDDPDMAQVEKLRVYGKYRNLNAIYTEALKIGAEILLQRLEQPNARIPIRTRYFIAESEKVSRAVSPTVAHPPAPAPVQAVAPEADAPPPAVVIPPMPTMPRIKPSL